MPISGLALTADPTTTATKIRQFDQLLNVGDPRGGRSNAMGGGLDIAGVGSRNRPRFPQLWTEVLVVGSYGVRVTMCRGEGKG